MTLVTDADRIERVFNKKIKIIRTMNDSGGNIE